MKLRGGAIGALASLVLLIGPSARGQTVEDFFNDGVLHDIRLTINPADWRTLQANFLSNDYYPCDFTWRGITVPNAGIRSRGRGSRSNIKPGLRVDFNRYEEQRFLGLHSVALDNQTQDPSMMKEPLSMLLFRRMDLAASREAHARLFINNQYWGLYGIVESVDKRFLKAQFGEDEGYLYKYNPLNEGYHFEYRGTDLARYSPEPFEPETHEKNPDPRSIEQFIRNINQASDAGFPSAMAQFVDLKQFVQFVAAETYLTEFDGILGDVFGMNNFYLYRSERNNFHRFIAWDKDGTFTFSERPLFQNASQNVLMRRALAIPELRQAYLEALVRMAVLSGGAEGWLEKEADKVYNQIHEAALADVNKQCPTSGVAHPCTNAEFEADAVAVKNFGRERTAFVLTQAFNEGYLAPFSAPAITPGGAVNAATSAPGPIAPGSLVSLYGQRFGEETAVATTLPLPTTLAGVTVLFNGFPAPLLFVSPEQINLQVPWEVTTFSSPITVVVKGVVGNTVSTFFGPYSPGVFAVVHNADGVRASERAAAAGDILLVFANGLGPVNEPVVTGRPMPTGVIASTLETPVVRIGGVSAEVLFSGLAPGFVGLYQINLRVPPGVAAGSQTPLVVTAGGISSSAVTIATN